MQPLTKSQLKEYKRATKCHICFKPFGEKGKVRDHCHYSGLYRGAAHFSCNLLCKIPSYIPVIFHDLAGYDAHLFVRDNTKRSHTQLNSRKQVIAFQDRVMTINIKEAQHPLK